MNIHEHLMNMYEQLMNMYKQLMNMYEQFTNIYEQLINTYEWLMSRYKNYLGLFVICSTFSEILNNWRAGKMHLKMYIHINLNISKNKFLNFKF